MIYKLLVVDRTGMIAKRMEDIFTKFVMDYLVFHTSNLDETEAIGKKERIDIIFINGSDYQDLLTKDMLRRFKEKIVPPPKLVLFLENRWIHTLPLIEGEVHEVVDMDRFRTLQMLYLVDRLALERARERCDKIQAEMDRKKSQLESNLASIRQMREDLQNQARLEREGKRSDAS